MDATTTTETTATLLNPAPDSGAGTRHPIYKTLTAVRRLCRDADDGQEAIVANAVAYVPQPAGLDNTQYRNYVKRPAFYAAVERTIDSGVGIAFRTDPEVVSSLPADTLANIDLQDHSVMEFARRLFRELLLMGMATVVVDVDPTGRPFWRMYRAEDLYSWQHRNRILSNAVVHDIEYLPDAKDPFKLVAQHQLTEYILTDSRAVQWVLEKGKWVQAATVPLTRLGEDVDALPVFIAQITTKPPMRGLANKSMEHFRLSCDLMHALHWSATAQPYVSGAEVGTEDTNEGQKLVIGSTDVWELPEGAQPGYMEFEGKGCTEMREQIVRLESQMAAMGARLLAEPTRVAETAETVKLKSLAETALLVLAAGEVSKALTWAIQTFESLAGTGDGSGSVTMSP